MMIFRALLCCLLAGVFYAAAANEIEDVKAVRDYRIHYTVFDSAFIQADTADHYRITQAADIAVVNIALTRQQQGAGETLGLPALVTGTATDMLGKKQMLQFQQVNENGVYYYLAQFKHTHLDRLTFDITLQPAAAENASKEAPLKLQFSRTLWIKDRS